jgi:hypothetical protein
MLRFGLSIVIGVACCVSSVQAHDFTWDTLLIAKMKLQPGFDYAAHVDPYMKVFRPNTWNRCRNNEFLLQDARKETIKLMQQRVKEFDLNEDIELNLTLTLGKYDFETSEFPVVEATGNRYWYVYRYTVREFPRNLKVFLKNPERISKVPMPKDVANQFLQRRKDRYGNVSRRIVATVSCRIVKLKNAKDEFLVEVRSAKFFDDIGRKRLIYKVVEPKNDVEPRTRKTNIETDQPSFPRSEGFSG